MRPPGVLSDRGVACRFCSASRQAALSAWSWMPELFFGSLSKPAAGRASLPAAMRPLPGGAFCRASVRARPARVRSRLRLVPAPGQRARPARRRPAPCSSTGPFFERESPAGLGDEPLPVNPAQPQAQPGPLVDRCGTCESIGPNGVTDHRAGAKKRNPRPLPGDRGWCYRVVVPTGLEPVLPT